MLVMVNIFILGNLKVYLMNGLIILLHLETTASTAYQSITPSLDYLGTKIGLQFDGSCLKQHKIIYTHEKIVNIYIVYETSKNFSLSSYTTLENCLFGAVSLTKYVGIDEYKYSGYGYRFDRKESFSVANGSGRNCIIFGIDMSSFLHVNNKKNYILILSEGPTQGLDGTKLTAETRYSISFTENNQKFCLILRYNGANSYSFVTEVIKFKEKDFANCCNSIISRKLFNSSYSR